MFDKSFDRMQEILAYAVDIHAKVVVNKKNWKEAWLTYENFKEEFKIEENEAKDFYHQFKTVQLNYFETKVLKESEVHKVNEEGISFYYQGGYVTEKSKRKRERILFWVSIVSLITAMAVAFTSYQQYRLRMLMQEQQSDMEVQILSLQKKTDNLERSIKSLIITTPNKDTVSLPRNTEIQ